MKHYVIGEILENGTRVKGLGEGGYEYFLDTKAFYERDGICYKDESNCEYSYEDFISLTRGNDTLAEKYFLEVSGTSPELLLEQDLNEGEICECPACNKLYSGNSIDICLYCNYKNKQPFINKEMIILFGTYV